LLLLDPSAQTRRVSADELGSALTIVGSVDLPEPIRSRDSGYLSSVARLLRSWSPDPDFGAIGLASEVGGDPVASCPQLRDHLRWVRRIERAERELRRTRRRLERDDEGIVRHFRAILELLASLGYTADWSLTEQGQRLRYVYNELDLLLTESVHSGLFDELSPADLAALASAFTFQARRDDVDGDWPNALTAKRGERLFEIIERINDAERRQHLPETRLPDPGFAAVAHAWATGHDLDDLFDDDLAAGDFVRNCRQLLDLLRQLRDAFPSLRSSAGAAVKAIDRGVVAAGGRF
jgi:ATP-dependent RNA helicase HelY